MIGMCIAIEYSGSKHIRPCGLHRQDYDVSNPKCISVLLLPLGARLYYNLDINYVRR